MNEVWMFHPEALKGLRLFFGDPNITERIFRYQVSTPRGKKSFWENRSRDRDSTR